MREPTPAPPISSIPQKRAFEEDHSPVVSSPLNPEVKPSEPPTAEDTPNASRAKSGRPKKESFKKREARGGESARATPDPKGTKDKDKDKDKEPDQPKSSPLRYKLAPPKSSDFEAPRGPVLLPHHEITNHNGQTVEFFETSDQCVEDTLQPRSVTELLTFTASLIRKTSVTYIASQTLSSPQQYTTVRPKPNLLVPG